MTRILRAELLKLRTTRTFVALVGAAAAISLLAVVLATTLGGDYDEDDVRGILTSDFSSLFIVLLAVSGMAGEWRHRTITSTVLAAPDRIRLLAAKMLAYAVAGAVLSLLVSVTMVLVGSIILSASGEPTLGVADLADLLWRNLVVAAFLGAFGVCVGGLVRNQVAAVIGLLVVMFAVEPTLLAFAPEVGRFAPFNGAPSGVLDIPGFGDDDLLSPGVSLLVMAGWIAGLFAATAAVLRGRDLT